MSRAAAEPATAPTVATATTRTTTMPQDTPAPTEDPAGDPPLDTSLFEQGLPQPLHSPDGAPPAARPELIRPELTRPELARPRLADLFVLTATLSVFLGLCRYAFGSDVSFALWELNAWETIGYGAGVACCWAGVYRMLRPYGAAPLRASEWQPGEMICLAEGAYYLIAAVMGAGLRYWLLGGLSTVPEDDATGAYDFSYPLVAAAYVLPAIGMSIAYGAMAKRVTVAVWRLAALAKVAGHLGGAVILVMIVSDFFVDAYAVSTTLLLLCFLVPTGMVLLAAAGDRKRAGVHWMHWMGIVAFALIYVTRLALELRVWLEPVE
ncbi:MAG: hypothetical protein AAGB00_11915 [Planctomycetota bacterium]